MSQENKNCNLPEADLRKMIAEYSNELQKEGSNKGEVLFKTAKLLLENRYFFEAIDIIISCKKTGYESQELEDLISQHYYAPYRDIFETTYSSNVEILKNYRYIFRKDFPEVQDLYYLFIPVNELEYIVYDKLRRQFVLRFSLKETPCNIDKYNELHTLLIGNEFNHNNITCYADKTKYDNPIFWAEAPLYLYYDSFNIFVQFLQVIDVSKFLYKPRIVFLFGQQELISWFDDSQTMLPNFIVNSSANDNGLLNIINEINTYREKKSSSIYTEIKNYYDNLPKKEIIDRIKSRTVRILFFTSYFTTALQYYIRDCAHACDKLGIPNMTIIEKSDIHRVSPLEWVSVVSEFKPDIVFMIDHYKWEYQFIPSNIFFVTWEQDNLPHMLSPEAASKINGMDLIFNQQYDNIHNLVKLGYPSERMLDGPVPGNPEIYKQFDLSEEEKSEYGADLCYFSNTGVSQVGLQAVLNYYSNLDGIDKIQAAFRGAYDEAFYNFYHEKPIYSDEDIRALIIKHFKNTGIVFTEKASEEEAAKVFKREVIYRIVREIPLIWLHEKQYDMKLYGMEWTEHPILNKYAMGVAQNGEKLSRIINATKITLGLNPVSTCHPRIAETVLSGGFYLCMDIPKPFDLADIRKYLVEGEDIVFAYSRKDLYDKIDYYLNNDMERKKIVESCKAKIHEHLTFEVFIKRVLDESEKVLQKNSNKEILRS